MSILLRRSTRSLAVGLGALALAAGAAACSSAGTGGDAEASSSASATASSSSSSASDAGGSSVSAASDAGGDESTDPDLLAAEERVVAYFQALAAQDAQGACGMLLDASTGAPLAGEALDSCAAYLEEDGVMESFTEDVVAQITVGTLESSRQEDGTVAVTVEGSSTLVLTEVSDGEWAIVPDETD
ncbi:hypothetical protein ACXET9_05325 [Brachybacterium sp. DNPG3]